MRAERAAGQAADWDDPGGVPEYRIETWSAETFAARVDETMNIYVRAMQYPSHAGTQRGISARKHVKYEGFSCRAAVLTGADTVVGFGYGYTTTAGQWWHDLVRHAIGAEQATEWMRDGFELSELHVLPAFQGYGLGRQLLIELANSLPNAAMLLSTPDQDTRAFRMYTRLGFRALRRQYLFPGDARPFAIFGARLPLAVQ
ncbi:MAG TPA: GNAT family N-acetyltransferase [Jatrophihabitans sp.]|jgi:ribosomal protein S18 acetylase RimI-like enzyme